VGIFADPYREGGTPRLIEEVMKRQRSLSKETNHGTSESELETAETKRKKKHKERRLNKEMKEYMAHEKQKHQEPQRGDPVSSFYDTEDLRREPPPRTAKGNHKGKGKPKGHHRNIDHIAGAKTDNRPWCYGCEKKFPAKFVRTCDDPQCGNLLCEHCYMANGICRRCYDEDESRRCMQEAEETEADHRRQSYHTDYAIIRRGDNLEQHMQNMSLRDRRHKTRNDRVPYEQHPEYVFDYEGYSDHEWPAPTANEDLELLAARTVLVSAEAARERSQGKGKGAKGKAQRSRK